MVHFHWGKLRRLGWRSFLLYLQNIYLFIYLVWDVYSLRIIGGLN